MLVYVYDVSNPNYKMEILSLYFILSLEKSPVLNM